MPNIRLIARLDVKGPNLIKGIRLEGVRVIGDPGEHARAYYRQGIDELLYVDAVASLYQRNSLKEIVRRASEDVFVPMTVAGGVRSVGDVEELLRAGADKVAINTAAVRRPALIHEVARRFGSQCMVLSIEAKAAKTAGAGPWEPHVDGGREPTGLEVLEWARRAVDLGAGEILLTSVDREGTRCGFDCELVRRVASAVPVPVIASGGMGSLEHLREVVEQGKADAVAFADVLHYHRLSLAQIRAFALDAGLCVRAHAA
ncbi:MAG: imidazole glycerol phosphate synthase cyclase subunit [Bryobacteraceae bacterium]|jgi:cyclase